MNKILVPIMLLLCLLTTACTKDNEPIDIISTVLLSVDSHTDAMIFLGEEFECLRVKEGNETEWTKQEGIIGFKYEKGYKYQLKVEKICLATPPQDSPNVKYRLIEVLSKEFDGLTISLQYAVDADNVEAVESRILSDVNKLSRSFYLLYDGKLSGKDVRIIELIDKEGNSRYKYGIEMIQLEKIDKRYTRILPKGQIVSVATWILHETIDDNGVDDFFVIFEKESGLSTRFDQPNYVRPWLYKDKTDYYRQLYPDAGVRSVIVVQTLYK